MDDGEAESRPVSRPEVGEISTANRGRNEARRAAPIKSNLAYFQEALAIPRAYLCARKATEPTMPDTALTSAHGIE